MELRESKEFERVCPECGKKFKTMARAQKYCNACRQKRISKKAQEAKEKGTTYGKLVASRYEIPKVELPEGMKRAGEDMNVPVEDTITKKTSEKSLSKETVADALNEAYARAELIKKVLENLDDISVKLVREQLDGMQLALIEIRREIGE